MEIRRNDYLTGGITPEKARQLARLREIAEAIYGPKNELDDDLAELQKGIEEGTYDPNTMEWKDTKGGAHSQRCNARRLSEGEGTDSIPPDKEWY